MPDSLRIMLVDDDPSIADILTPVLSDNGYEVVVAESGPQALELTPIAEPDLYIIDVMMPDMDGFELTQRIRQIKTFENTPIIFLSALDSRNDIQKAYSLGVTVYLTKPVSINRLLKNMKVSIESDGLQPRPKLHKLAEVNKPVIKPVILPPPPSKTAAPPAPKPAVAPAAPRPIDSTPRSKPIEAPPAPPKKSAAPPSPAPAPSPAPRRKEPLSPFTVPEASSTASITPPLQLPRVMIVEDDTDIIEVMRVTLEQHFEVVTACDGLDAVKKMEAFEPDMYIIDLMMPRFNGYQLIHAIRNTPATAESPILVVTAKSSRADEKRALSMGSNDFMTKPFQPKDLQDHLARLTQLPGFHVISPKKLSMREIIEDETRRRIHEEEKQTLDDMNRKVIEEKKTDPFAEEEHIRRKESNLSTDFTDMKKLFKKGGGDK